jgi:hypothetical protein
MRKTLIALAAIALLTVSCNKSLNKEYNKETVKEDLKEIVANKEADTTDAVIIAMYIVEAQIKKEKLEGKTYKELLDKAKETVNTPAK